MKFPVILWPLERKNTIAGTHDEAKLLTSKWPDAKNKSRKEKTPQIPQKAMSPVS